MIIDTAALLAKLKELEAQAPGFLAALKADLANVATNQALNGMLAAVSPTLAGKEQAMLTELQQVVDTLTSVEAHVLPFVEQLIAAGGALLPFILQLVQLFVVMTPKAEAK